MLRAFWKMLRVGGWAPLLVLLIYTFLNRALHAYLRWPWLDIPTHFSGGLAIGFLVSRCFQGMPRQGAVRSRVVLLELVLVVTITATAAVFWEFAEFAVDQVYGTNLQVSLANTMRDLAMGMLGATVIALVRARQLSLSFGDLLEVTADWARGPLA
ncbi:MAG: hypothetical protein ACM3MF_05750 [Anaerolineae bacterium]